MIKKFEDLDAWKKARELTRSIYAMTRNEHFAKDYGLKDQICRSSVSIMSNVAEGYERDGDKEFANFLSIAKGSAGETRSLLYVALDQNYISELQFDAVSEQAVESSRIIYGLSKYLRESDLKGRKYK